jgi:uncharacterized coiled-coil protein SlyX
MAVSKLRQDLATADRHIAQGEARIAQQGKVVRELDADGHNTTEAQSLLRLMQRNLNVMNAHRQEIVHELSRTPDEPI